MHMLSTQHNAPSSHSSSEVCPSRTKKKFKEEENIEEIVECHISSRPANPLHNQHQLDFVVVCRHARISVSSFIYLTLPLGTTIIVLNSSFCFHFQTHVIDGRGCDFSLDEGEIQYEHTDLS